MEDSRLRLIADVTDTIARHDTETDILRAAIELIDAFSESFDWTGFYVLRDGVLEVGPYIGPLTEHTRIELDSGICGAAASQKKTVIVDDVNADPRFLACSLTTRSEIVVPLMDGNTCLGEIDIDSNQPSYFDSDDKEMLEKIAEVIVKRLKEVM